MKSNNTKILIFYGPRKNFDKIIKNKEEIEYFTPLVQEYDKENKKVPLILEGYKGSDEKEIEDKSSRHIKSLVIYSDEYSTITEGAVQNFSSILNFFEIEEIILQNPPLLVPPSISLKNLAVSVFPTPLGP
ncbi:MAG TPA: hypothetical protein DCZ30_00700 [Clostridiales bacterium]|nr:hypothetical protein [Clostridiales bacterium]